MVNTNPAILTNLSRRIVESSDSLELVAPIALVEGGEQIKNDPNAIETIFQAIDRDGLDRRSYILVIGGGAVLDAVGQSINVHSIDQVAMKESIEMVREFSLAKVS